MLIERLVGVPSFDEAEIPWIGCILEQVVLVTAKFAPARRDERVQR
jgi:hypothetical protein